MTVRGFPKLAVVGFLDVFMTFFNKSAICISKWSNGIRSLSGISILIIILVALAIGGIILVFGLFLLRR